MRITLLVLAAALALAPATAEAQTSSGLPAIFGAARPGAGKSSGSSGLTIGTTAITGGVSGGELFQTATGKVGSDSGFTYAGAGGTLTLTPAANTAQPFLITGGSTTAAATSKLGLSVVGTLNTSGNVDGAVLFANILNTQSGASTFLIDLLVGSTSKFLIDMAGNEVIGGFYSFAAKTDAQISSSAAQTGNSIVFMANTNQLAEIGFYSPSNLNGGLAVRASSYLGFTSAIGASPDTSFSRDGAGLMAQQNSTNAQTLRVYNTFTSTTSYERGTFDWNGTSNVLTIGTEKGSGGGSVRNMQFIIGGAVVLDYGVTNANILTTAATVGFGNWGLANSSGIVLTVGGYFGWSPSGNPITGLGVDTTLTRSAAGVVAIGNIGAMSRFFISNGAVPVDGGGSCLASSFAGGSSAGTFAAAVCAAGTISITFAFTAPTGWSCDAQDRTTPADTLKQTATTTTKATFTATTVAADVIQYKCTAY